MRPKGPDNTGAYFDFSHPGARAHMAECICVIREEMDITYFKVDFMHLGIFNWSDEAKTYDLAAFRGGLQTFGSPAF